MAIDGHSFGMRCRDGQVAGVRQDVSLNSFEGREHLRRRRPPSRPDYPNRYAFPHFSLQNFQAATNAAMRHRRSRVDGVDQSSLVAGKPMAALPMGMLSRNGRPQIYLGDATVRGKDFS